MSTIGPTPLPGTSQAQDVESLHPPPVSLSRKTTYCTHEVSQVGGIKLVKGAAIAVILDLAAFCVLASALSCFTFFASIALGRSFFTSHSQEAHARLPLPDARSEYIVSVPAGGIFLLSLAGLRLIHDAFGWKLPLDDDFRRWLIIGLTLVIIGPACVAASSEILRAHVTKIVVGTVVLHYLIGSLILLGCIMACCAAIYSCIS